MCPNKFYRAGYMFEKRVKAYYEKLGWGAQDSRGSHGAADIVAGRAFRFSAGLSVTHVIQCKTSGKISKKECEQLLEVKKRWGAEKAYLAYRVGRKLLFKEILE